VDDSLVYVDDGMPGWQRVRRAAGFSYRDHAGKAVRSAEHLQRIRSLAIPPAYEQVWICPLANGHLQATGRDARGRKQYRYHALWQAQQGQIKFERLREFGAALPTLRRQVKRDLDQDGLPRSKVLAALVRLLDTTYLRVGNHEYARENGSYGLTTLRTRHAKVRGSVLALAFRGKSGIEQQVQVQDARLARIVRRCQALPGQALFQYLDDQGEPQGVGSADVNRYLREHMGEGFSAKDFRTWHASALALDRLLECEPPPSLRVAKATIRSVIGDVAKLLGHTIAVCRKSYVHEAVLARYGEGSLVSVCSIGRRPQRGLQAQEQRLMALLKHRTPAAALKP
jgi:DNA topoisomerase-1